VAEVEAALARSPVLLVGGESGIGKTRVALEVARHAEARGAHVLTGHCPEPIQGVAGALEPLRAPLLAIADRCREWGAAEAARILGPRAARLAPYQPALAELGPAGAPHAGEHASERLIEDLVATFRALAEDAPLLLVLDDLQWADSVTLELVRALHRAGTRGAVRVLGLYRTEAVGAALATVLAELGATTLALGRVDEAAVGEMAAGMLALPAAPPGFARALSQQSEGSPFFVAEYLRVAVAEGLLTRSAGAWRLADGALGDAALTELPLPGTLRQLVARRLDGLSRDAQRVACVIAVLGRRAELEVIAELCPPELDLPGATSELIARVTLEDDGSGLRFAHDRLREGAYARLSASERSALHGAAAAALARPPRRTRDVLPALAQHLERAGDAAGAMTTYLEAATRHRESGAYLTSLEMADRALALEGAPQGGYDLARVRRADILGVLNRYGEASDTIATLLADEARLEPVVRARAHGCAALVGSVRGQVAEAVRHAQLAVASVPTGDHELRFKMTNIYAQALAAATQLDAAAEQLRSAARSAATLDDPELIAAANSNLGIVLRRTGDLDGAEAAFEHAIAAARRLPAHPTLAAPLCNLARVHVLRDATAQARALLGEGMALAESSGQRSVLANARLTLADAAFSDGDLETTTALARQALAETPKPLTRGAALRLLGRVALARADHATAARELAASLDIMTTLGERDYEAETVLTMAELASAQGDPAGAATLRTRARDLFIAAGLPRRAAVVTDASD